MNLRITKGPVLARVALDRVLRHRLPTLGPFKHTLDVGGKRSPYRSLIRSKHLWTLDIVERYRPGVVCDVHELPIDASRIDFVLASQTLEHCRKPQRVIDETWRVLQPAGIALYTLPFAYIIHGDPSDYYRFTQFALEDLFSQFSKVDIQPVGNHFAAVWDLATANKSWLRYLNYLLGFMAYSRKSCCPCGYMVVAEK